jgi:O-antigen ligase
MGFLLNLLQFVQPGMLMPSLAPLRPSILVITVCVLGGLVSRPLGTQLRALVQPVVGWATLFVLIQVISVYDHGLTAMLGMFLAWLDLLAFVLLGVFLCATVKQMYRFIWGLILGLQFIVFYGVCAVYYDLPVDLKGMASAYGTYANHNDYTYAIIFVVPFTYFWWRSSRSLFLRPILLCFLVASVAGVALSLSRGGMLGLVFEGLLIGLVSGLSPRRVMVLVVVGLIGLWGIQVQWQRRAAASSDYTAEDAETSRFELWRAAKNAFVAHPILGIGSNRFQEYARDYGEISHDNLGKNTHNTFIEVLANNGLVGFVVFLFFLRSIAREFRVKTDVFEDPRVDAMRLAGIVALYSFLFRGLTNAKPHEAGLYALAGIAGAYSYLRRQAEYEAELQAEAEYSEAVLA